MTLVCAPWNAPLIRSPRVAGVVDLVMPVEGRAPALAWVLRGALPQQNVSEVSCKGAA